MSSDDKSFAPFGPTKDAQDQQHDVSTYELPKQISRYQILQVIGHGGMGQVYMPEQSEPVKRRVALKVIKTDTPTKGILDRFEAERQAVAMMDHQNIAKVLDAGITDEGRPYVTMELEVLQVSGVPATCTTSTFPNRKMLRTRAFSAQKRHKGPHKALHECRGCRLSCG